jgi:clan AA aspartic protease (TIGR02281 family)
LGVAGLMLLRPGGRPDEPVTMRAAVETPPRAATLEVLPAQVEPQKDMEPRAPAAAATERAAPQPVPTGPTVGELLGLARKLVASGALFEAEGLYRRLLDMAPDLVDVHLELGLLCSDLGKLDCAVAELRRALELRPGDPEVLEPLAAVLRDAGEVEPAIEAYRQLIAQNRLDPKPAFQLARMLDAAGRTDEAVVAYQDFLNRFPDAPESAELRRRFEELTRADASPDPDRTAAVPITRSGSAILVTGEVEDATDVRFLVDTGSTLTIISTELADELGFDLRGRGPSVRLETANGPVEAPLVTLESVRLGRALVRNVQAAVYDIQAADPIDGLLGLSFLDQFRFTIDASGRVMHLEPR